MGARDATSGGSSERRWRWRVEALPVAALVIIEALHAALLVAGHHTYFAAPDNTTQFYAWYQKAAAALHSGAIPVWDENTLSGHSFVGEAQTGVFYPINLIWLLAFGSSQGIGPHRLDMLVELHLLIAMTGFYALCRSFGAGRISSVAAGAVFAYTGPVFDRTTAQTAIFFGLTLVPWAVFFAHRRMQTGKARYAVAAGVPIGLAVLAGHFQPPFHAALIVFGLYLLARRPRGAGWRPETLDRVVAMLTTFAVSAAVALPQLVYTLPYLSRAYRFVGTASPVAPGGTISFGAFESLYSGAPDSVLSLLDPQRYPVVDGNSLYITLVCAAVVLLCLGRRELRRVVAERMGRYRVALLTILGVGALAMLGPWTPLPHVLYVIPFVSEVRELARYSILVHLVLCLLVAFALDALRARWFMVGRRGAPRRARLVAGAVGGVAIVEGLYLIAANPPASTDWLGIQVLLSGLATAVLAVGDYLPRAAKMLRARRLAGIPAATAALSCVLALIVIASFDNDLLTVGSTSSAFYAPHYYARTPAITYASKACAGHRTLVLGNALPVNVADVYRRLHTQNGYGATMQTPYFDFINSAPWDSPLETRLLDLRCVVTPAPASLPGYTLGFRDPTDGALVYVNPHTSPLNRPDGTPLPATAVRSTDRDLEYSVDLPAPTRVVISAIEYPGWQLRVDGRSAAAESYRLRGEPIFPETTIAAGRHTVSYSWSGWPL